MGSGPGRSSSTIFIEFSQLLQVGRPDCLGIDGQCFTSLDGFEANPTFEVKVYLLSRQ